MKDDATACEVMMGHKEIRERWTHKMGENSMW